MSKAVITDEDLLEINIPNVKNLHREVFYGRTGLELKDSIGSVAKISYTADEKDITKLTPMYFVKYRSGQLFDPFGMDSTKINLQDTIYKKVTVSIFNKYMLYIKTKREVHLHDARREFLRSRIDG